MEIFNAGGQITSSILQRVNSGKTLVRLEIAKLAAGSYQVRIRDEKGTLLNTQFFVKH
jgi:hypothetical protein